jgi:hypothetical protein
VIFDHETQEIEDTPGKRPRPSFKGCLVVLAGLALLGIFVGSLYPLISQRMADEKWRQCCTQLTFLAESASVFAGKNQGYYPRQLKTLIEQGYLTRVPQCPASTGGAGYQYRFISVKGRPGFLLYCPDGHGRGMWREPRPLGFPQYHSESGLRESAEETGS